VPVAKNLVENAAAPKDLAKDLERIVKSAGESTAPPARARGSKAAWP